VYTSSVAAIGVKHGGVADETHQSPPSELIGAYKQSKYRAEQEALAAARTGQDVVIVNPTTPLGPWDRKPTPTGDIVVRFLRRTMPAMVETGLNFVDVRSVARGHIQAYEKGRSGERYILGGENLAMRELLAKLGALTGLAAPRLWIPYWIPLPIAWLDEGIGARLGRRPSIPIDGVRMSRESMYYDASKARSQLGFAPGPLDDALTAAIDWYVTNGYAPAPRPASPRS
jgi:dihydroflavonol-4-reductase